MRSKIWCIEWSRTSVIVWESEIILILFAIKNSSRTRVNTYRWRGSSSRTSKRWRSWRKQRCKWTKQRRKSYSGLSWKELWYLTSRRISKTRITFSYTNRRSWKRNISSRRGLFRFRSRYNRSIISSEN